MNRMKRIVALALGLGAALVVGPGEALAGGFSVSQPGVFRTPTDPWAHWGKSFHGHGHGLRHGHHGRFHHFHGHGFHHQGVVPGVIVVVPQQRVFVPGQWVWNGFVWFWIPPHWAP